MKQFRQRKKNRLETYNYSWSGSYFVTFNTKGFIDWFGSIKYEVVLKTLEGIIAEDCWNEIPSGVEKLKR